MGIEQVPPAYQWYPKDALSSARIQKMTLEEEGAYRRLLDYQWLNGSIPADLGQLSRLCKGISKVRMAHIWEVISECFIPCSGGFMNLRLETVRDAQRRHREERSTSGKRGAEARHRSSLASGSATEQPLANSSSASASATASAKEGELKPLATRSPVAPKYSTDFEAFWRQSTQRGSKFKASQIWEKLAAAGIAGDIQGGMDRWKGSEQWQDETKQPHITTWLSRRGWEELVPIARRNGNGNYTPPEQIIQAGWLENDPEFQ